MTTKTGSERYMEAMAKSAAYINVDMWLTAREYSDRAEYIRRNLEIEVDVLFGE